MGIESIRALKEAAKLPKIKKVYRIASKSAKTIAREKDADNDELIQWFKERRKEMKGICSHCGGKSMKDDDTKYHYSIAHLLPKAYFPSVATHPMNSIELCFWSPSCHTNYDNGSLDLIDLNCFDTVINKFVAMYPAIEKIERKRIPAILLNYLEVEK
jgi:predicted membrane chloride channel (bestrophin family)